MRTSATLRRPSPRRAWWRYASVRVGVMSMVVLRPGASAAATSRRSAWWISSGASTGSRLRSRPSNTIRAARARLALLEYKDGEKTYIIAPNGLQVGAKLMSGPTAPPEARQQPAAADGPGRRADSQSRNDSRARGADGAHGGRLSHSDVARRGLRAGSIAFGRNPPHQ